MCEINVEVDKNLSTIIRNTGKTLKDIKFISPLRSQVAEKGAYKIIFEDGTVLKGRAFETDKHAKKVYDLLNLLNFENFPKTLSILCNTILLQWIKGDSIEPSQFPMEMIKKCGTLLSKVHSFEIPEELINKYRSLPIGDIKSKLDRLILGQILEIENMGFINSYQKNILSNLVMDSSLDKIHIGLVCGDFCAENVIIDESDKVFVIDNEKISIDAFEYDLARTFYRWSMNLDQRKAFMKGYRANSSQLESNDSLFYWYIRVLVKSAIFRSKIQAPEKLRPIEALNLIVKKYEEGSLNILEF